MRCDKGMTLVELLLSMTILAVIITVGFASFSGAISSWRVGTSVADSMQHADYALGQIVAGLRSAYYPDAKSPSGAYGMTLVNDGDEGDARDSLSWVKLGSAIVGADSPVADTPHRIVVSLIRPGESDDEALRPGGIVAKAWRLTALPRDFDAEDENFVRPTLIMPNVSALNFRILNPEGNMARGKAPGMDDELDWTSEEWKDDFTNRLPYAVEVSMRIIPQSDQEDQEPVEVKRVVVIPSAPLSWRDRGAAGGARETGALSSERKRDKNAGRPVRRELRTK